MENTRALEAELTECRAKVLDLTQLVGEARGIGERQLAEAERKHDEVVNNLNQKIKSLEGISAVSETEWQRNCNDWHARCDRAEARVKELEKEAKEFSKEFDNLGLKNDAIAADLEVEREMRKRAEAEMTKLREWVEEARHGERLAVARNAEDSAKMIALEQALTATEEALEANRKAKNEAQGVIEATRKNYVKVADCLNKLLRDVYLSDATGVSPDAEIRDKSREALEAVGMYAEPITVGFDLDELQGIKDGDEVSVIQMTEKTMRAFMTPEERKAADNAEPVKIKFDPDAFGAPSLVKGREPHPWEVENRAINEAAAKASQEPADEPGPVTVPTDGSAVEKLVSDLQDATTAVRAGQGKNPAIVRLDDLVQVAIPVITRLKRDVDVAQAMIEARNSTLRARNVEICNLENQLRALNRKVESGNIAREKALDARNNELLKLCEATSLELAEVRERESKAIDALGREQEAHADDVERLDETLERVAWLTVDQRNLIKLLGKQHKANARLLALVELEAALRNSPRVHGLPTVNLRDQTDG